MRIITFIALLAKVSFAKATMADIIASMKNDGLTEHEALQKATEGMTTEEQVEYMMELVALEQEAQERKDQFEHLVWTPVDGTDMPNDEQEKGVHDSTLHYESEIL